MVNERELTRRAGTPPEDLTAKQRDPPPAPTEPRFPCYTLPAAPSRRTTSSSSQRLCNLFASVRSPRDITPQHLTLLNLQLTRDVPLSELTRPPPASEPSLPPKSPVTPSSDRLNLILTELSHPNHPAYREITRLPPLPGHSKLRLAHARKFWIALEHLSVYWDTGLDTVLTVPDLETEPSGEIIPGTDVRAPSSERSNSDTPMPDVTTTEPSSAGDPSPRKLKHVYTGHRTSTGSACPPQFLEDAVHGFLEPLAWSFNSQIASSSPQARLAIRTLLLSVRPTFVMGRTMKERELAKKGVLEGPVLGCWCREWDYEADPKGEGELREREDLLREMGAIVELAQERARGEREEEKPGKGMWWTHKPRWGGGTGGSMGWEEAMKVPAGGFSGSSLPKIEKLLSCGDKSRKRPLSQGPEEESKERRAKQEANPEAENSKKDQTKMPKRNPMVDKWKIVRPGASLWDRKWRYRRIGRKGRFENEEDGDEIFLVSAVNHHISVLRAVVTDDYLRWLGGDADADGGVLQVQRTRWFDLLDREDRVELMKGLWELMEGRMATP